MKKIIAITIATVSLAANAWVIPEVGEYKFEKQSENVYIMHGPEGAPTLKNQGFMNNPGIIIGKNGITVIDPGSSYYAGKKVIIEIEKITKKPILAVFNTHVHGDHWLGNHAISEKYPNVEIYANPVMIEVAKAGEAETWIDSMNRYTEDHTIETKAFYPTKGTSHLQSIKVGSEEFIIHSPTKTAHTNTDIMIEHVGSKTLFLGDNLFSGRIGRFDSSSSIHNTIKVLDYADKLGFTTYVPGHGISGSSDFALKPFVRYLDIIKEEAYKGYDEDLADYEIKPIAHKRLEEFHNWLSYDQLGVHLGNLLREIDDLDE